MCVNRPMTRFSDEKSSIARLRWASFVFAAHLAQRDPLKFSKDGR